MAAKGSALRDAGIVGARVARERYRAQRQHSAGRSPTTLQTISWRTDFKHALIIYVGTLRGAIFEFGASRANRGVQPPRPYLRPGADAARAAILPLVRERSPHGKRV